MSTHRFGDFVLSGGALDVVYKLHFFGPQEDGGLPSKGGMGELIKWGLAVCNYNERPANRLTILGMLLAEEYPWKRPPKALEDKE